MSNSDFEFPADDSGEYYAVLNLPRDAPDDEVRRAYRNMAQAYHPDKHTDPELKDKAQEAFSRLQEAYEVLSDPNRRQVYDVYGKAGLMAGFELGTKLDSLEEIKKKWEEFQKKQAAERSDAASNHRGTYLCKVDASDLRRSLTGQQPLFRQVVVQNSIDTPVGEGGDVAYIQGQAVLRNAAGAGNLIFGYRRVISPHDTLDGSAVLGLRCALSLTSTRQVTPYTTASLTSSYSVGSGWGMHLGSTRQLPYNMQATLGWMVGPSMASGMTFNISKRGTKYIAAAKLELGAVTAVSARLTYHPTPTYHLRAIVRAGGTGVDLELGAGRKWGPATAGYMGAVVGLQGVTVKGRLVRGGQTFEVPVVLSHAPDDLRALAAAYLLPPLAYVTLSRCVVRPLVRWQRQRKERRERQQHAEAVRGSLQKASSERLLIEPVARRKARSETAKRPLAGLIILDAVYGSVESYLAEAGPQQQAFAAAAAAESTAAATTAAAADRPAEAGASGRTEAAQGEGEAAAAAAAEEAPSTSAETATAPADAEATELPPPPPWLPVAAALQYIVVDSKLTLHPGISKKSLMGFADPMPGADESTVRQLYVAYSYGSRVYEVTVDDTAALQLPSAVGAVAVADVGRQQALLRLGAAQYGVPELLSKPTTPMSTPRG
ncbi:hypothetical protein Agub_g10975 [Astrephomene gubernaculifera]|uniref:J domain-containing protein n=1 Tax=Astrephomene gubernaculifera TaxID=47775 RepID=A0AAD3E062_9CHLO|nr:hypothetical protein Agub_g10975 [Astrephomene gubernaculifera]